MGLLLRIIPSAVIPMTLRDLVKYFITIFSNQTNLMRLFFCGILFLLVWNIRPAFAQDRYASAQNGYVDRAPNLPTDRFLGSIRFRVLIDGIVIGKVRLGDFPDSLNFIFDTGCGGMSLDSMTAQRLKSDPRMPALPISGGSQGCVRRNCWMGCSCVSGPLH